MFTTNNNNDNNKETRTPQQLQSLTESPMLYYITGISRQE